MCPARQNGCRRQARCIAPFASVERDRVALGLISAFLIALSHAPDELVS
jgi:hypothetical protein